MSQQLVSMDKVLLPIFGFESIVDYKHILIYENMNEQIIDAINENLETIMHGYKKRHFNLYKTKGKIETINQAFNLLKRCLLDLHP